MPGWTPKVTEVSNGVYNILLPDRHSRKVETTGADIDAMMKEVLEGALSVEKQISLNWNKFLFDLCLNILADLNVEKNFDEKHFGLWIALLSNKRIVYDGRDHWLISQIREGNYWYDACISTKEDLALDVLHFTSLVKSIK
ncbi:MAG: hypothetical protein BGO55_17310 [Sphingobacteriales bacterium 50-39]|nr:MAG: hypothetical protein BGO55_17310 [Sphingobacteriales bacterium 50-39]